MTYRLEQYAQIAGALHVWPQPRAHFQNVALLPYRCGEPCLLPVCIAIGEVMNDVW